MKTRKNSGEFQTMQRDSSRSPEDTNQTLKRWTGTGRRREEKGRVERGVGGLRKRSLFDPWLWRSHLLIYHKTTEKLIPPAPSRCCLLEFWPCPHSSYHIKEVNSNKKKIFCFNKIEILSVGFSCIISVMKSGKHKLLGWTIWKWHFCRPEFFSFMWFNWMFLGSIQSHLLGDGVGGDSVTAASWQTLSQGHLTKQVLLFLCASVSSSLA